MIRVRIEEGDVIEYKTILYVVTDITPLDKLDPSRIDIRAANVKTRINSLKEDIARHDSLMSTVATNRAKAHSELETLRSILDDSTA